MPLPNKTPITSINLGDPGEPGIANQPHSDLEQNIDDIRTFLNDGMVNFLDYDPLTTSGLSFGHKSGIVREGNEVSIVAAGNVALTAATTNYVYLERTSNNVWDVVNSTTTFSTKSSNIIPLFEIVTDGSSITTITDWRTNIIESVDKDYVDAIIATPPNGIKIPYGQRLEFVTSHNDDTYIYKNEPSSDVVDLRISVSNNPGSANDIISFGTDNGTYAAVYTFPMDGAAAINGDNILSEAYFATDAEAKAMTVGNKVLVPSNLDALTFESTQQTITSGATLTIPHGLGVVPRWFTFKLICQTAELGYSVGDEIFVPNEMHSTSASHHGMAVVVNATNIIIEFGSSGSVFLAMRRDTNTAQGLINANWKAVFIVSV